MEIFKKVLFVVGFLFVLYGSFWLIYALNLRSTSNWYTLPSIFTLIGTDVACLYLTVSKLF